MISRWLPGAAAALLVALPWLDPLTFGPSSGALPWLASAACALLLWAIASRGFRLPLVPGPLVGAAAALVLAAALPHFPLRPEIVMLAGGLAVIVLGAAVARAEGLAVALQAGLLAAAVVNALFGLAQYFGLSEALSPVVNITPAGVAYGNLRQTNQFATACWIGAAVLLFGTLRVPRAAAFACMVILAMGSAASVSRTGMVEIASLLVLAAWWNGRDQRPRIVLLATALVVYAASAVLLPALLESFSGAATGRTLWARFTDAPGCSSRRVVWANVLHLIGQKPFAGWGWGELDYAHYMTLYDGPRFCEILDNAHNLPLHLAVELGLPAALLAMGGALWWALRQRPWAEPEPRRQLAWAVLALLLLHSLLEYPLWYGPFQIACGLAIGWLLVPASGEAARGVRGPAVVAAAALFAATAYAAWDYARVSQIYLAAEERWPPWRDHTMEHVRGSWLFGGQARFADLTLATPSKENAQWMNGLAEEVLHYSPEPRVIERAIESAVLAGREDEALLHLARFRAAFPADYENWRTRQHTPLPP